MSIIEHHHRRAHQQALAQQIEERLGVGCVDRHVAYLAPEQIIAGCSECLGQAGDDPHQGGVGTSCTGVPEDQLAITATFGCQLGRQRSFPAAGQAPDMRQPFGLQAPGVVGLLLVAADEVGRARQALVRQRGRGLDQLGDDLGQAGHDLIEALAFGAAVGAGAERQIRFQLGAALAGFVLAGADQVGPPAAVDHRDGAGRAQAVERGAQRLLEQRSTQQGIADLR